MFIKENKGKKSDGLISPKTLKPKKKEPTPKVKTGNKGDIVEKEQKCTTEDGRELLI